MYKTYLMVILAIMCLGLWLIGVIDDTTLQTLLVLLGFGGLAGLRDAITKMFNDLKGKTI